MNSNQNLFELRVYNYENTIVISRHKFASRNLGTIYQNYILNKFDIRRTTLLDLIFNLSTLISFNFQYDNLDIDYINNEYNKAKKEIEETKDNNKEYKKHIECIEYLQNKRNEIINTLHDLNKNIPTDKKILVIVRNPLKALITGIVQDIKDVALHISTKEQSYFRAFMDDKYYKFISEENLYNTEAILGGYVDFKDDEIFKELFIRIFKETVNRVGLQSTHGGLYLSWLINILNSDKLSIVDLDSDEYVNGLDLTSIIKNITNNNKLETPSIIKTFNDNKLGSSNKVLTDIIFEKIDSVDMMPTKKRLNEFLVLEKQIYQTLTKNK